MDATVQDPILQPDPTTQVSAGPVANATAQYLADWQTAQEHYQAGVNAGYSEADASQMYLDPVREKWNILKTVPNQLKAQAATALDNAHTSYLNGIQAGYKSNDAENIFLKPEQMKWSATGDLPQAKPLPKTDEQIRQYYQNSPAMQDEAAETQSQIDAGVSPKEAIAGHPMLLTAPGFSAVWRPQYEKAVTADAESKAKATQAATPEAMQAQDQKLEEYVTKAKAAGDTGMADFYTAQKGKVDESLTNQPDIFQAGKFQFQPPAASAQADLPSGTPTGAAPKYLTKFRTTQDVADAYHSGELSRDEAKKILNDQFNIQ